MKIVYNYRWKELTDDGLLKEPDECGAYYDRESVNGYSGFESEKEAEEALINFKNKHEWSFRVRDLVLVKVISGLEEA